MAATAVGLWVCACSSDPGYAPLVGSAGGFGGQSNSTGGVPGVSFGGKTGGGKVGVPSSRFLDLCPEVGGVGVGGAFDIFGGAAGVSGTGATVSGGVATGGAFGSAGQSNGTTGGGAGGAAAGGVPAGGTGDEPGGEAGTNGGGTIVPCPSEPPIALEAQECPGPGVCSYIDRTVCRCAACGDSWCWQCTVRELQLSVDGRHLRLR
jgi:hypothetical protein